MMGNAHSAPVTDENRRMETDLHLTREIMKFEDRRRQTFKRFQSPSPDFKELARSGLFYDKLYDSIYCAHCEFKVGNKPIGFWPNYIHSITFPTCKTVAGFPVAALGLNAGLIAQRLTSRKPNFRRMVNPLTGIMPVPMKGPFQMNMKRFEERMQSFPSNFQMEGYSPANLANLGFYYSGKFCVSCFYCGEEYSNSEINLMEEHGSKSSNCAFGLLMRGQGFEEKLQSQSSLTIGQPCSNTSSIETLQNRLMEKTKELADLTQAYTCKICLSRRVQIVYFPCHHGNFCVECGLGNTKCPICSKDVKGICKIFI